MQTVQGLLALAEGLVGGGELMMQIGQVGRVGVEGDGLLQGGDGVGVPGLVQEDQAELAPGVAARRVLLRSAGGSTVRGFRRGRGVVLAWRTWGLLVCDRDIV